VELVINVKSMGKRGTTTLVGQLNINMLVLDGKFLSFPLIKKSLWPVTVHFKVNTDQIF